VVSNFDNPLGSSLSNERKEELVKILQGAQVPLIEDDINGDLCHNVDRPTVAKAWDRHENVLLCSSFSKTLAPGFRVGWIAPGKYFEEILHQKIVSNIASTSPTQLAVAEFLENGGYASHLRKIGKAYAAKVAKMAEAIGTYFPSGTKVTRPEGGFTLWLELDKNINTGTLYAEALKKSITIAPGTLFSNSGRYSNCLRLNGAFWSEETRWAVEALGRMVHKLADCTGK
jgi:DNA-binding transcriptional MocR family regulator